MGEWTNWVSVKDKMLKDDSWVLVYKDSGFMDTDWFKNGFWQFCGCDIVITHWMYLPEPPEEVSGDG